MMHRFKVVKAPFGVLVDPFCFFCGHKSGKGGVIRNDCPGRKPVAVGMLSALPGLQTADRPSTEAKSLLAG